METRGVSGFLVYVQILAAFWGFGSVFADQQDAGNQFYFEANQYYEEKNYEKALEAYYKVLEQTPAFVARFPEVRLKVAFCLYQTGQFLEAAEAFQNASLKIKSVKDYSEYFAAKSQLQFGDTNQVIQKLRQFRITFAESPLKTSVDSMLASLYFQKARWDSADIYYRKILTYAGFDKGDIYGHLIVIAKTRKHFETLKNFAFELIEKYPFHPQSRMAYRELQQIYSPKATPNANLQQIYTYLEKTDQFAEITELLDQQKKLTGKTELLRWLEIRQLYAQRKYWASLQESHKQRSSFTQVKYKRNIDLNIARCNLNLGFMEKAIEAYDVFQKRYPSDGLSPEVLWVIAWLCEKQDSLAPARGYYQQLIRIYPGYEFVNESRFRIGLSYYRQGDYPIARGEWQNALPYEKDEARASRVKYWISKTYYRENDFSTYLAQLDEISDQPFDNYYNMKAFLLTKDNEYVREFVDSLLWEISHKPVTFLPKYLDYFQRPLLVQEIFGEGYAQKELNLLAKTLKAPGWEITFALGEINEKMLNYGRAYRLYRQVYNENFANSKLREWIFLFRNLYPLYFDHEVNEHARKWNITPASIWAIIKKESAFEPVITSYANAYGLMQIIPPTADRLSESLGVKMPDVRQLYDPDFNILLGSYYLSELLKRYEGNLYHALAAYNAGEHRVDRWRRWVATDDDDFFMENIEYEQTRDYVRSAMKYYWTYHLLIHPYKMPEDLSIFPEKVAHEPWFREAELFE